MTNGQRWFTRIMERISPTEVKEANQGAIGRLRKRRHGKDKDMLRINEWFMNAGS